MLLLVTLVANLIDSLAFSLVFLCFLHALVVIFALQYSRYWCWLTYLVDISCTFQLFVIKKFYYEHPTMFG